MSNNQAFERLTENQALLVYASLIQHAGANSDPDSVASFVFEFTREKPTNEYRFQGNLGFGGKFRFPRFTVDCYPPEKHDPPAVTAEREQIVSVTNARLAELHRKFLAEQA
jgi:hypothetical protein